TNHSWVSGRSRIWRKRKVRKPRSCASGQSSGRLNPAATSASRRRSASSASMKSGEIETSSRRSERIEAIDRGYNLQDIRGRPGFDVVDSPAELQAEVPGRPRKTTGKQRKCG